ncbi:MAG: hypothetical protein E6I49_02405 [Chloroflexi bacterium]|nr:MAG: hypothetical protein E6I49_02405 [Chloroflexota bacterium]
MDKTTRRSIDVVLAEAQARLRRLSPFDALAAVSEGWTLVDTRDGDELGFTETTDVIGGFGAWLAAGLPVER